MFFKNSFEGMFASEEIATGISFCSESRQSRCFFAQKPPSVEMHKSGVIPFFKRHFTELEHAIINKKSLYAFIFSILDSRLCPEAHIKTGISVLSRTAVL